MAFAALAAQAAPSILGALGGGGPSVKNTATSNATNTTGVTVNATPSIINTYGSGEVYNRPDNGGATGTVTAEATAATEATTDLGLTSAPSGLGSLKAGLPWQVGVIAVGAAAVVWALRDKAA